MSWIILIILIGILINQFSSDFSIRREFDELHHELKDIQELLENHTH
ncbi:MAG: hypothetical protein JXD21_08480 [Candidatus Omnitrophica bacterium]|nr:hypothetical protein [Candidatus Omnitrophota bacterium]